MNEKLAEALGYVDEKYVSAAAKRKKRKHYWVVAVAAVLALVLVLNTPPDSPDYQRQGSECRLPLPETGATPVRFRFLPAVV